jgi:hypothetical protein
MSSSTSTDAMSSAQAWLERRYARSRKSHWSLASIPSIWENQSVWDLASGGLFLTVGILIVATFTHYGITWDEPVQDRYGTDIVNYYRLLLHGKYVLPFDNPPGLNFYSGLFDTIAAPFNLLHYGLYEARHFLNAIVGLMGIVGCWKIGRLVGGAAIGFWSALLLTIAPRYYGAMFNNPKDIPFAVGYIWSVYYILQFANHMPRIPRPVTIRLGIAIGATLATRVGGVLLFIYLGAVIGTWLAFQVTEKGLSFPTLSNAVPALRALTAVVAISWFIMLAFWPWAQTNPLLRPIQALTKFSHYSDWQGSVLFEGATIKATALPRIYIVKWLLITLPEIFLLAFVLSALYGVGWIMRGKGQCERSALANAAVLMTTALFPLAYVVANKTILYNAERHLTFIVPPLACLAAWGSYRALSKLSVKWKRAAGLAIASYLIFHVGVMIRLHPDEYVYFNQLVGGLKGANGQYDTDYWGNSFREAVRGLAAYTGSTGSSSGQKKYRIYVTSINRVCVTYYFPPNFALTFSPADADFFIGNTSIGTDKLLEGRVVLKVERLSVPLAVVKDLSAPDLRLSSSSFKSINSF